MFHVGCYTNDDLLNHVLLSDVFDMSAGLPVSIDGVLFLVLLALYGVLLRDHYVLLLREYGGHIVAQRGSGSTVPQAR